MALAERAAIECGSCDATGLLEVIGGELQTTLGFRLDEFNTPVCTSCDAPAGISAQRFWRWRYDAGPNCPEDEVSRKLDEARARQRADPVPLAPLRRW